MKIPLTDITVGMILSAIIAVIIGIIAIKIIIRAIRHSMKKGKMGELLTNFVCRIVKIFCYIFIILVALSMLGFNFLMEAVAASLGLSFIIGYAAKDTIGSAIAGLFIAIVKPFRKGDFVDSGGKMGTVIGVNITNTLLRTIDNKNIIVPNSEVWSNAIINYTANKTRRIDLTVGIGYGDDINKAMKVAMDVISNHKNVLKDPAPMVAASNLGDSSVDLVIRPWVKVDDYWPTQQGLIKQIKEAFDEAGINIPFPQRDIHIFQETS